MTKSHKKKPNVPVMVAPSTVFSVTSRSTSNRGGIRTQTGTLGQGAGSSSGLGSDQFWQEDISTNAARAASAFSYQLGDVSLESQLDDAPDDGINVILCAAPAQKKAARPLHQFYPLEDEFVGESLRREGRGAPRVCENRRCEGEAEWHCVDQGCFGEIMHCSRCVVAAHAQLPTHFLERWNGTNFVRGRNWLPLGTCCHLLGLEIDSKSKANLSFAGNAPIIYTLGI
ncbi:hypothetical protein B0H16DRAFT_1454368 [Mycena metata]|uniref:CxC2-like cysteine cluster KDZ transposase-associated domain-containing protein n=1 Tax=Mycena metata TaxID=1033252 RepID=A0AAD7JLT4_9AGAR|nr:hypothetical protein B0H16DRAFT_1454368 [Mycena metata]